MFIDFVEDKFVGIQLEAPIQSSRSLFILLAPFYISTPDFNFTSTPSPTLTSTEKLYYQVIKTFIVTLILLKQNLVGACQDTSPWG